MRAFQLAARVPWLLTPDALRQILSIAARENEVTDIVKRYVATAQAIKAVESYGGVKLEGSRNVVMRGRVAIIPVVGVIFRYADFFSEICGGATVEGLARDQQCALDDANVDSIIYRFDTPGGEAAGIEEFAAKIFEARGRKPIYAYVGECAASAGYWLAAACDEIVVARSSLLGSCGVVAAARKPDPNSLTIEIVSSQSPEKRPDVSTEEGLEVMQTLIDRLADVFIADVAKYRGLSTDQVLAWRGGLTIGEDAVRNGMADEIGSFEGLVAELQNAPLVGLN